MAVDHMKDITAKKSNLYDFTLFPRITSLNTHNIMLQKLDRISNLSPNLPTFCLLVTLIIHATVQHFFLILTSPPPSARLQSEEFKKKIDAGKLCRNLSSVSILYKCH